MEFDLDVTQHQSWVVLHLEHQLQLVASRIDPEVLQVLLKESTEQASVSYLLLSILQGSQM